LSERTLVATLVLGLTTLAAGQPDPSGIEFVTIGSPGNQAYTGFDPLGHVTGRGAVDYEFRLGRMEVTTGQWMEFFNTFGDLYGTLGYFQPSLRWGAARDPNYQGPGERWVLGNLPDAAMVGGFNVSWRTAARYCNWLHHGKSSDPATLENGAYDISTFGFNLDGTFTDQLTHNPGARYWIPTLDEWLKAEAMRKLA